MRTEPLKKKDVTRQWFIIDAKGKVLGRAASQIACLLTGKYLPNFTPSVDGGAGVIVLNCDKVVVTGDKSNQKIYKSFSGYPGGLKTTVYSEMMAKKPKHILRHAVRGMLPRSIIGDQIIKRLKLYVNGEHPHIAQKPIEFKLK
ncbi:MAG: 50S ribosomal protein L13 [Candidatus Omnitrophica bacterium]|nr:50S ribosomal protein L13 [Candidatus Omnitrophota bacterium]